MGSSAWQVQGPYSDDPAESLTQVQHAIFVERYNLAALIPEILASSEQCVAAVEKDDEYGLYETYSSTLTAVRVISRKPIPADIDAQIKMLRDVVYATGEPLENILDFTGISSRPRSRHEIYPLSDEQLCTLFGTSRPTPELAAKFDSQEAYEMVGRGGAVYFPVFTNSDSSQPVGLMFVGYTID